MVMEYRISITTGNVKHGGTNSRVHISLIGKPAGPNEPTPVSGDKRLNNEEDNFEKGKVDIFTIDCKDIGELEYIHLQHDNAGRYPGWNVMRVEVQNVRTGATWFADGIGWLALTEPPRVISRTIPVTKIPG
ncbi:MAG: PLAT/LH2 domain-containing protein [Cyanobacteriota bacterium]|jgi:hypothetical protein